MNNKNNEQETCPALHLENQFCFSLYSLSRKVTQRYTPLLKPLDLTYPQYLVMLVLWQHIENEKKSVTVSQLTEALKLDTGTITPLLKRMETKNLLTRQRSKEDERVVVITLTSSGVALREKAKSIPQSLLCESSALPEDIFSLRDQLKKMLDSLE